jgi:uncharacterized phage protein (TIGR01671 family)
MREIIFRGKRVDNGEWVCGDLSQHKSGKRFIKRLNASALCSYEVIPETLGQFTGLTDNNGKRIFEGDIVKTKFGRLCKMIWRQTQCFVGWDFVVCDFDFDANDFSKPPSGWDLYLPENLEVLGNSIEFPNCSRQKGAKMQNENSR